jgi:tRNA(fMet)-specific endonuclease VapC
VQEHLASAAEMFLPVIVFGELYYGSCKSTRVTENLLRIGEFATSNTILINDRDPAREYGEIKNALRVKGQPIPENDIWIAAIAKQHNLTLATRDAHFA